jgi:NADH-quinone oxidoreductase subunit N
MPMNYLEILKLAAPETMVALLALLVLFTDGSVMRRVELGTRRLAAGLLTVIGCALTLFAMTQLQVHGQLGQGIMVVDTQTQIVKGVLLVLTLLTAGLSIDTAFTEHVGEYFGLLLFATVGMMFLVSAENILMIFVALELTSLSLYVLTAFNKRNAKSAEAALKYFLYGSMAAAVTLFGLSWIYGLSGELELRAIATKLAGGPLDPMLAAAIVMVVAGFAFKIAAVPFHLWAPDAYQGAPTPSAALIASGSKVASFYILAKTMTLGFAGAEGSAGWRDFLAGWLPLVATIAVFSMVLGNVAAIAQTNLRRLLAYSAIAHAGYMLLAVLANSADGVKALIYYTATYGLTSVGAFAVVAVMERSGAGDEIVDCRGLWKRSPLLAITLMICLLSLAGIPPLAGFFGKFYLFVAAATGARSLGLLWLVFVAVAMSAVSLYYYVKVLKEAFVRDPEAGAGAIPVPLASRVVLLTLLVALVLLGCLPSLLLGVL